MLRERAQVLLPVSIIAPPHMPAYNSWAPSYALLSPTHWPALGILGLRHGTFLRAPITSRQESDSTVRAPRQLRSTARTNANCFEDIPLALARQAIRQLSI
jgi:hypothetical protein